MALMTLGLVGAAVLCAIVLVARLFRRRLALLAARPREPARDLR